MNWSTWDTPTRALYRALQEYRKAFEKYSKADPSPEIAKRRFDAARDALVASLRNPAVTERINRVMNEPDELLPAHDTNTIRSLCKKLKLEINLSQHFGLNPKQVTRALLNKQKVQASSESMRNSEQLIQEIEELHRNATIEIENARGISERVFKKKRKKNIAQGITSIIFGSGCFIANSYSLKMLPTAATSYSVGLFAFHQAARDIIGGPQ